MFDRIRLRNDYRRGRRCGQKDRRNADAGWVPAEQDRRSGIPDRRSRERRSGL